ncbi:hypothetical protein DICVIV_01442 [Dictyocaulus viviparus]|uniref:Uncharacterized protein n=1 Tax=Dictyocaulus viviparus TaxID=29172 RepID=A0A0D8Y6J8_DICVI|nr:hypothetical protein DICVIV_01442 [Dictyocaulus viviparus]
MSTTCTHDLVTPFLTRMLGQMQVLSTNLKCNKQQNGEYLYEYSVQVRPDHEDEDLAALLRSESRSSIGYSTSDISASLNSSTSATSLMTTSLSRGSQFETNCVYMVEVRFILLHQNMNGKAQLRMKEEFPCYMSVREVIDYFRIESDGAHRGVFAPRLAYNVGRTGNDAYRLMDYDLGKTLAELCGKDQNVNTVTIIADLTN